MVETGRSDVKETKRGLLNPRVFSKLIVAGIVVAVFLSLWLNVLQPRTQKNVPGRLGDLDLVEAVTGAEALTQVNNLHGLGVSLSEAVVATYTHISPYHGNSRATVWVGRTESMAAAVGLTRKMAESIAKGGSPFNNLRPVSVSGLEVFQVDGPGGIHYFYSSREKPESVIWISIEAPAPEAILEEAIKAF
jgi:hypothetical protein